MIEEKLELAQAWKEFLGPKNVDDLLSPVQHFLNEQKRTGKTIFPPVTQMLRAFDLCPPELCKCIILGQDPYHGAGQAHGLAFSVDKTQRVPASLKNIFKEYQDDLTLPAPVSGDLSSWAAEGVLLLNTVLSVEKSRAGSHFKMGWEQFSDHVLKTLGELPRPLVFVLWGAPAQKKKSILSSPHHLILEAPHPSPLSSYRGFFGSKPFTQVNAFLEKNSVSPINWNLSSKEK